MCLITENAYACRLRNLVMAIKCIESGKRERVRELLNIERFLLWLNDYGFSAQVHALFTCFIGMRNQSPEIQCLTIEDWVHNDSWKKPWTMNIKRIETSVRSISNAKRLLAWWRSEQKKTDENNTSAVCRKTHISIEQRQAFLLLKAKCYQKKRHLAHSNSSAFFWALVNDSCWCSLLLLYCNRNRNALRILQS